MVQLWRFGYVNASFLPEIGQEMVFLWLVYDSGGA
jgi:hypothetical protein